MSVSFTLSRAGLEVYTTKNNPKISFSDTTDASTKFNLENGEITNVDYIGELYSDSYEQDYTDISSNANLVLPMDYYSNIYKGRKVAFKKGLDTGKLKWDDMDTCVYGFITEVSYNQDKINVKIDSVSKLLDQEKKFTFKKTKISKIIKAIVKESGLKAHVDVTGLKDSKIDFTNISSSGESKSSASSDVPGIGNEEIDSLVKKIVGDETNELKKCKLVHKWLQSNVKYPGNGYSCSRYDTPNKCLKNKHALNCADTARLTRAMMASAGLKCYVVHRTYDGGHFWVIIEIDGKKYASDQTGSGSAFNTVWKRSGRTSVSDGGKYSRKNGDNPDC